LEESKSNDMNNLSRAEGGGGGAGGTPGPNAPGGPIERNVTGGGDAASVARAARARAAERGQPGGEIFNLILSRIYGEEDEGADPLQPPPNSPLNNRRPNTTDRLESYFRSGLMINNQNQNQNAARTPAQEAAADRIAARYERFREWSTRHAELDAVHASTSGSAMAMAMPSAPLAQNIVKSKVNKAAKEGNNKGSKKKAGTGKSNSGEKKINNNDKEKEEEEEELPPTFRWVTIEIV